MLSMVAKARAVLRISITARDGETDFRQRRRHLDGSAVKLG